MTARAHIPNWVKREAAARQHGLCPITGWVVTGNCELDHVVPKALGGGDDPGNLVWLHKAVHKMKTANDVRMICKADRQCKKAAGLKKRKGRKLQSRGFATRFRKRLDGKVERR